jgi:hypothetical protein
MTVVETMVAAVILTAGTLGVLVMVETADSVNKANRGREAATSLSRELLESARSSNFATIGDSSWFNSTLTSIEGGSGSVSQSGVSYSTTVERRGYSYSVRVDSCSVDDPADGLKNGQGPYNWCADSTATGSGPGDTQPEDLKRVGVLTRWTEGSKTQQIYHTATFSSAGSLIGPALTLFELTSPVVSDKAAPVITSTPTPSGNAVFTATSIGAADMEFTVDGVKQVSGVSGPSGSTWTLNWNVTNLKDGVYTVGATATDALGTRGDPQYIQVKLARGAATAPANVTGGYNDVYSGGTKTRVVELAWDASPEGTVTGYEVMKGATVVCAAQILTECMDLNPATDGSTTYTIKTLYTDASGNAASVSTDYSVTAPAAGSSGQTFWFANSTTISQTKCRTPSGKQGDTGSKRDKQSTQPAGTEATWTGSANGNSIVGCAPPFTTTTPMTASTTGMKVSGYFRNTGASACTLSWQVFKNGSVTAGVAGNGYGGGSATGVTIPAGTTTPTLITKDLGATAQTFVATDQLTIQIAGFVSQSPCSATTFYYNSAARPASTTLPLGGGGSGPGTIERPAAPSALAGTNHGNGTTTLTWTPPTGTPAAEFYRVYRDGQNYVERVDTVGDPGTGTIEWVDTNTGGTTHVYRVTAVSPLLAESDFAGPITR